MRGRERHSKHSHLSRSVAAPRGEAAEAAPPRTSAAARQASPCARRAAAAPPCHPLSKHVCSARSRPHSRPLAGAGPTRWTAPPRAAATTRAAHCSTPRSPLRGRVHVLPWPLNSEQASRTGSAQTHASHHVVVVLQLSHGARAHVVSRPRQVEPALYREKGVVSRLHTERPRWLRWRAHLLQRRLQQRLGPAPARVESVVRS